jgi:hypothetical protein
MSMPMTTLEAINDERWSLQDYEGETSVMEAYFRAEAAFRDAIATVNKMSNFAKIDAEAFENFCHDELPDPDSWRETIEETYRG